MDGNLNENQTQSMFLEKSRRTQDEILKLTVLQNIIALKWHDFGFYICILKTRKPLCYLDVTQDAVQT